MATYGKIIESYEPDKDTMYKVFSEYFNNPTMTKIKNINIFSMYMSKTYCLLSMECRYIIVFVLQDAFSIGAIEELVTMRWVSLQTRELPDKHTLPPHSYNAVGKGPLTAIIIRTSVEDNSSTYSCESFPITITLLNSVKKNSSVYQDRGTVIAAIETYNTIITIE
jgi:hypothetical protein